MSDVAERIQEEVTEIAEVLARQRDKPMRDVWAEALSLHRVRYVKEVVRGEVPFLECEQPDQAHDPGT
jgi:hypothetical protein